jgi:hypothetical protein
MTIAGRVKIRGTFKLEAVLCLGHCGPCRVPHTPEQSMNNGPRISRSSSLGVMTEIAAALTSFALNVAAWMAVAGSLKTNRKGWYKPEAELP